MPVNQTYSEKELLLQIVEGDENAFIQLHDHYYENVYYAALSFLKSHDKALDCLQNIFFNLWKKRAMLARVENIRAFLMTMVRNELINTLQSQARRNQVYQDYGRQLPADFMNGPGQLEYKELETLISQAVASLTPKQQEIYRLTREEGLSHQAVAEKLGLSAKTIANTITGILNYLRTYLSAHGKAGYIWLVLFFL